MKKLIKALLSVALAFACLSQTTLGAFAASSKKEYVSDVILSYGNTADEAKKWLTDNGYQYVNCDLNDGADDAIFLSKERAVYMGYKTTNNSEEAITDMKLMNMNGGYSVQDYQLLLEEKKADIKQFINQFIDVLSEYRINYQNNSPRALAACEMLNMIKEDDTGMLMGDLLLNKIKEEYSEEDFNALSAEKQKKHADMTTVLMQGNAEMVLFIEEILATATDTNEVLWLDRLADASDYDTMLEEVMDEENVTPDEAETILATQYDDDAKIIGGLAEGYREWISDYADCDVKLTDSDEKISAYIETLSEDEQDSWCFKGSQYEMLAGIEYYDNYSLLDIFLNEELDITGNDIYLLYPIVSILTDGQRSAIDFMCGYQFFAMGYNTDAVTTDCDIVKAVASEEGTASVYDGVDRSIFSNEVALTGEAYKLQTSTDKDYSTNWFEDGISGTTKIFGIITLATMAVTVGAFVSSSVVMSKAAPLQLRGEMLLHERYANGKLVEVVEEFIDETDFFNRDYGKSTQFISREASMEGQLCKHLASQYSNWAYVFRYAAVGLTVATIIMSGVTLWKSYNDLKAYYNVDFTPIPMWMVDQGVDENDAKTFTYYKVVECNRIEKNFTADNTKLLKNFGDINGDVGKQWLALYTTKDKNAGKPILADFKTQSGKSDIPGNYTPLSIFCYEYAQNLTDEKAGYTYNDSNNGIYLFYNVDSSALTGSAITTGVCVAIAGGVVIIGAAILFIVRRKKKNSVKSEA